MNNNTFLQAIIKHTDGYQIPLWARIIIINKLFDYRNNSKALQIGVSQYNTEYGVRRLHKHNTEIVYNELCNKKINYFVNNFVVSCSSLYKINIYNIPRSKHRISSTLYWLYDVCEYYNTRPFHSQSNAYLNFITEFIALKLNTLHYGPDNFIYIEGNITR